MRFRKNAAGWLIMVLSCTAVAARCSPRVEIADGTSGEGGESGEGTTSGASYGGGASQSGQGQGARSAEGGKSSSSAGRGGSTAGRGSSTTGGNSVAGSDPGSAGDTSAGAGGSGEPAVCTPGADQTCNDNLAASAIWGHCEADRTCTCNSGFVINPASGKCTPPTALSSACSLPKDPGNCLDTGVPHYYFDVQTGRCAEFAVYCGGTPRNANAFKTLEECESACVYPACDVPFADGPCDASIPVFSHDPSTGVCAPRVYGGCGGTPNRFASKADCESACTWDSGSSTAAVTIRGTSCVGFGSQVSQPGDESDFEIDGNLLEATKEWGCGCPSRPEFVMMYTAASPIELRLCHDEFADTCEGICSAELSWDLSAAFQEANTDEFVFAE